MAEAKKSNRGKQHNPFGILSDPDPYSEAEMKGYKDTLDPDPIDMKELEREAHIIEEEIANGGGIPVIDMDPGIFDDDKPADEGGKSDFSSEKKDEEVAELTKDDLAFLGFVAGRISQSDYLLERFKSNLDKLPYKIKVKDILRQSDKKYHHSPKKMVEFLSLFSRDDRFKWYTHKWDQDDLKLENLIKTQKDLKPELSDMVYRSDCPVNEMTYNQVWNFINFYPEREYPWVDNEGERIRIGWHSIVDLQKQFPDIPVENLKLPDGHLFKDYIRLFKSSIEFRTDLRMSDRFSKFIRNSIKRFINGAVSVEYTADVKTIGYDLSVYCDIPALLFGLQIICDWIVKHKIDGDHIVVDLSSDNEAYELTVLHQGSYFSNRKKLENPSGDFDKLRKRLFSVCDLTLKGDFKEDGVDKGSITVFGLEPGTQKTGDRLGSCRVEFSDSHIGGVKYVFKLYR